MSNDEWFRRTTWTQQDQVEFFARLRRSRGAFHKAQYARIQAYTLQRVGTSEMLRSAIELLDMILAEWHSGAQLAMVHHQYTDCFLLLGQRERAIDSFRAVFCTQRQNRGTITRAHLDFGWLAVTVPLPELYSEVLEVLDEFQYAPVFPNQIYKDAAIRALIHHARGEDRLARDYANRALSAASRTRSPLPQRPTLGLVTNTTTPVQVQLQSIAAS